MYSDKETIIKDNKAEISREVLRTYDEATAKLKVEENPSYFLKEVSGLTYLRSEKVNNNQLIRSYLKTRDKLLLEDKGLSDNPEELRKLINPTLDKYEKGFKLSKLELESLCSSGYLEQKRVPLYIIYENIKNSLDISKIKTEPLTYDKYLEVIKILLRSKGYEEVNLPLSVTYKDNFSFLEITKKSVVSEQDNYYLEPLKDENTRLLKPHCTGIMLKKVKERYLKRGGDLYFSISQVYRKETEDKSHSCSFKQLEITGIFNQSSFDLILKELLFRVKEVFSLLGIKEEIAFNYTYYPYTSPSVEFYDKTVSLELGGGGIFNFDYIKDRKVIGFALGLERIYMYKNKLSKISQVTSKK